MCERSNAARMATAPNSVAGVGDNAPLNRPIGVRAPARMTEPESENVGVMRHLQEKDAKCTDDHQVAVSLAISGLPTRAARGAVPPSNRVNLTPVGRAAIGTSRTRLVLLGLEVQVRGAVRRPAAHTATLPP